MQLWYLQIPTPRCKNCKRAIWWSKVNLQQISACLLGPSWRQQPCHTVTQRNVLCNTHWKVTGQGAYVVDQNVPQIVKLPQLAFTPVLNSLKVPKWETYILHYMVKHNNELELDNKAPSSAYNAVRVQKGIYIPPQLVPVFIKKASTSQTHNFDNLSWGAWFIG